jgi:molybdate transport system ATP-binding protein/molybdate transport system permease protein
MKGVIRNPLSWLGGLIVIYLAVPLIAFGIRLIGSPVRGFHSPGLFPSLIVSVESASISLLLMTLFCVPLAYLLSRSTGRLARVVGVVVLLPLALPPLISGILLIYLVGPYTFLGRLFNGHLTNSLAGVVLAQTFCAAPFLIVAARSAFASIDDAMLDVAAALGHSDLSRFRRVALPLAAPGIRAGMLLAWLRAFGEYGAVIVLAYHPFSLPVYTYNQFSGVGLPTTIAPTALALAVAAVVVLLSRSRLGRRPTVSNALPAPENPISTTATPVRFNLDLHLGTFRLALDHQSTGNHLAILGPSGSGKSVLLRSLVGLYGAAPGPVFYGNRPMRDVPVERRNVGYVAQGFTLFPHFTVRQQLLFASGATPGQATYWLEHLRLDGLQDRYPSELSGGQRQRVGLAQALCRSPSLILLDEPFSALDAPVRRELRRELRQLQQESGVATVLVTHEPEEAAFLADEVIVISYGTVLQAGTVRQVFSRPASPEVAQLLGIPNLFSAAVVSDGLIDAGGVHIEVDSAGLAPGTPVLWSIRPEDVSLTSAGQHTGRLTDVVDLGTAFDLFVALTPKAEIQVRATAQSAYRTGDLCRISFPMESISMWPDETGNASGIHSDGMT